MSKFKPFRVAVEKRVEKLLKSTNHLYLIELPAKTKHVEVNLSSMLSSGDKLISIIERSTSCDSWT